MDDTENKIFDGSETVTMEIVHIICCCGEPYLCLISDV